LLLFLLFIITLLSLNVKVNSSRRPRKRWL